VHTATRVHRNREQLHARDQTEQQQQGRRVAAEKMADAVLPCRSAVSVMLTSKAQAREEEGPLSLRHVNDVASHWQPGNVDTSTNWTHFYAKIQTSLPGGSGTRFTCCTSTKVQILTLKARREGGGGGVRRRGISKGRSRDDSCGGALHALSTALC
jgi:hypothetical protein